MEIVALTASPAVAFESNPSPPFVIANRYEVSALLGRGGFALVYRAHDITLDRDVAVKLLREEMSADATIRRFSLEMRVTAKLEHPNILRLYDSGVWNDRLYYVMELVRGPTLAARLSAEGALPIDDALSIARDIGTALALAHRHQVVHRDVKPENILLADRGALLADFGIASVLSETGHPAITSTGVAVGTTRYMSPEQLFAERHVDARTDQYSLALICYEMLTGVQPHVAASLEALRALRASGVTTPAATHRPSIPPDVSDAITRALAPSPADRFREIADFVQVLELARIQSDPRVRRPSDDRALATSSNPSLAATDVSSPSARRARPVGARKWRRIVGLIAAVVLVVSGLAIPYARTHVDARTASAGSLAIGRVQPAGRADSAFAERVHQELDAWPDVATVPARTTEGPPVSGMTASDFATVASRTGTEILMAPSVVIIGDSTRWTLTVFDHGTRRVRHVSSTTGGPLSAAGLRALAVRAIIGPAADSSPGIDGLRQPSLAAAQSFVRAWRSLHAGALDSSQMEFASAARADPSFAAAQWWAAQTAAWLSPKKPERWQDAARNALTIPDGLHGTDALLARALVALASDPPGACDLYQTAIRQAPSSFVAWFGLGQCRQVDSIVIRDPRADGGLRFRSSHWAALAAYRRALEYVPTPAMSVLMTRLPLVDLTYAASNRARQGIGQPPDTNAYVALPSLDGDSIALVPVPLSIVQTRGLTPRTFSAALRRGRQALLEFTAAWTTRAPSSPDAWFNRAYALELTGNLDAPDPLNSATKALDRAAALTSDREQMARVDVSRVRVAVRGGEFEQATRLARAAVSRARPASARVASIVAPLAAFVGDVGATNDLLRVAATSTDASDRYRLPPWVANTLTPWLADSLRAFGVRALIGVCDGLAARRDALESDLRVHIAPAELAARRDTLLRDIYRQAVPCLGASVLRDFRPENPVETAIAALDAGDRARARETLRALDGARVGVPSGSVSEDAVLIEAWVWQQAGDIPHSRTMLADNMRDIASVGGYTFTELAQAAALRRIHDQVSTQRR